MLIEKTLAVFVYLVFMALCLKVFLWLLNQKSDYLLIVAGLEALAFFYISFKTKAFTKNPFTK